MTVLSPGLKRMAAALEQITLQCLKNQDTSKLETPCALIQPQDLSEKL